jgi:hypothetical protein
MITYLLNQMLLAGFNWGNSRLDAYRILRNKHIAHGINFAAYAVLVGLLCWLGRFDIWEVIIFCISAFCNRQFSFDIPLNLRRHLQWDYVSTANPPKSITDRIEIRLFGHNGRAPFVMYGVVWLVCFIIKAVWL